MDLLVGTRAVLPRASAGGHHGTTTSFMNALSLSTSTPRNCQGNRKGRFGHLLQVGKTGSQSSLEKFDVHDILVEHFQPLFPARNLGIGIAKHCRTVFSPRQIVIYIVSANDCRT
jgi:hypothetical protein